VYVIFDHWSRRRARALRPAKAIGFVRGYLSVVVVTRRGDVSKDLFESVCACYEAEWRFDVLSVRLTDF